MGLPEYHMPISARSIDHFDTIRYGDRDDWLDLDAPYQRGSVWSDGQRRNLIRSLLIGIPIGAIMISRLPTRSTGALYRIIDGKQRIEAIRAFTTGDLTVPGHWFDDPHEEEPYPDVVWWDELSNRARRTFKNRAIATCEVDLSSTSEWVPEGTPGARKASGGWILNTERSDEEILAAEAEVYLLINRGGVPHDESDLDAARTITGAEQ